MKFLTLYIFTSIIFPTTFLLQVSAWSDRLDAEIEVKKIDRLNLNLYTYIEEHKVNGKSVWRVRVGDLQTMDAANSASNSIMNYLKVKPWLLKVDLDHNSARVSEVAFQDTIENAPNSQVNVDTIYQINYIDHIDRKASGKLNDGSIEINKIDSLQSDSPIDSIYDENENIKKAVPAVDLSTKDEFIYFDTPPKPKGGYGIKPVYPNEAKVSGIEGKVIVKFFVDNKGLASKIQVLKSSNTQSLDDAAIEAVLKSEWIPAMVNDLNIGVWQTTTINFDL